MLGINEIGTAAYHRQTFASNMTSLISLVRQSQPTARIYLLSLSPVSQSCSESRENVNRDNILDFNINEQTDKLASAFHEMEAMKKANEEGTIDEATFEKMINKRKTA